MSSQAEILVLPKRKLCLTKTLPNPNKYTLALEGEYSHVAFSEERAPLQKSLWRSHVFNVAKDHPVDLEIGTGNGYHFAHHAGKFKDRCVVGLELKYKPLIQAIKRAYKHGNNNAAICRYHAFNIEELFSREELNNIYIHFPDPWTSPKKPKNRVVNRLMLQMLFDLQKPGSFIEFKTDSEEMFLWALEEISASPYKLERKSMNLHQSEWVGENFVTFFESLFVKDNMPIHYALLRKP